MASLNKHLEQVLENLDRVGGGLGCGDHGVTLIDVCVVGEHSTVPEGDLSPALAVEHPSVREDLPDVALEAVHGEGVGPPKVLHAGDVLLDSDLGESESGRLAKGPVHLTDGDLVIQEETSRVRVGHLDSGDADATKMLR